MIRPSTTSVTGGGGGRDPTDVARRVARGVRGVVIARTAERLIAVRFDDGTVEHVHPNDLWPDSGAGP